MLSQCKILLMKEKTGKNRNVSTKVYFFSLQRDVYCKNTRLTRRLCMEGCMKLEAEVSRRMAVVYLG